MIVDPTLLDRTGEEHQDLYTLLTLRVIKKIKDSEIYLCENFAKSEPEFSSGRYFITAQALESLIESKT